MATIVVQSCADVGGDVLNVKGTVDGVAVVARGWVSATQNCYPASAYSIAPATPTTPAHLVRDPAVQPGPMSPSDLTAYATALLAAAAPPAPKALTFA